jgi:cytochrome c biogenesis protein
MSDVKKAAAPRHTTTQRLFLLLGSMDLAITLLIALSIASVIGTVLQQNQPYADYVIKFGPFWFDMFESTGLYDVYSALWFLAILTLLVISTSVCLVKNTPSMLKDMTNLRTQVREKSLRAMHHSAFWQSNSSQQQAASQLEAELVQQGFKVKQTSKDEGILISAMRGGLNRMGYILTHLAIVIICVGGLIDGNVPMKFAEWKGELKVETRNIPANQVAKESRLPIGEHAFRGSIQIPEGRSSNVAFVAMRDGYVVQDLPFTLEVEDFRVEHYATGQPKSFETDLIVHDKDLAEPLKTTISVNHPLIHKGYAIYQSSFGDGGSLLQLRAWPLDYRAGKAKADFEGRIFESQQVNWGADSLRLELTEFRPFNINPDPTEEDPDRIRNFGPSFNFKLRAKTGEAMEYNNYMLPVMRDGRAFYLSGVRSSPAEQFAYLYLPLDRAGVLTDFNRFLMRIRDIDTVQTVAQQMAAETLEHMSEQGPQVQQSLQETLTTLIAMYLRGGFVEVTDFIETELPEAQRETLGTAYLSMLREMLTRIFFFGSDESRMITEADLVFLQDAVDAIGSLSRYGSPMYLQLTDYTHVEASGLQIAKAPGKFIVYLGCALLIVGVFILFYLPQRRFWALVKQGDSSSEVILAGMSNRNPRDFDQFFDQTQERLKQTSGNSDRN